MPALDNRQDFADYCLRRLGGGIIQINVTDLQLSDRIDDALQLWSEVHMDGANEAYYKHLVTEDDITNHYLTIPSDARIITIMSVIPLRNSGVNGIDMFNLQYQMRLNDIFDMNFAGQLSQYVQTQQFVSMIDQVLNGYDRIRHHRRANRIFLDVNWEREVREGDYIIFKCTQTLDPEDYTSIWDDRWLKAYATALIKRQWGENMSKYGGTTLLGGVTFTGADIYQQAQEEIDKLEEKLRKEHELPPDFLVA